MEDEDLLNSLLTIATEQLEELNGSHILQKEPIDSDNKLQTESNILKQTLKHSKKKPNSVIHTGDTDSSDDEGNRNYEEQKYNECGQKIKQLINSSKNDNSISSSHFGVSKKRISTWKTNPNIGEHTNSRTTLVSKPKLKEKPLGKSSNNDHQYQDVFLDPIFCMRIINPKISSAVLAEKMQGRLAVRFSDLTKQIFSGNLKDKDWVLSGVVVSKSPPKTSQKGSQYSIWTLTDLKNDIKTVALFMFGSSHKDLWKTAVGSVIGVLNPTIMERKEGSKDEACLSVDTAQKVMVFGQSKDFGICKSIKKNGDKCTAVVNLSVSEFCIYHIKQEYNKCSKRSELQANFAGKGLVNLRNKVLGKNEVFYAGKSYMAISAKKNQKLETRDNNILQNLSGIKSNIKGKQVTSAKKKGVARHLDVNPAQRARDLELLKKLGGTTNLESKTNFSAIRSDEVTLEDSKATALNIISKLKAKNESSDKTIPNKTFQYDLNGDLYVNVDKKSTFSGKVSENISLDSSKNTALSVISRLKAKKTDLQQITQTENNEEIEPLVSLDEFQSKLNCDELNYSDVEDNAASSDVSQEIETSLKKANKFEGKSVKKSENSENLEILNSEKEEKGCQKSFSEFPNSQLKKTVSDTSNVNPLLSTKVPRTILNNGAKTTNNSNINVDRLLNVNKQNNNAIDDTFSPKNSLKTDSLDKMTMGVPMLLEFGKGSFVDLNKPITLRQVDRAKKNALKYIQRNGPIKKIDPNSTKSSGSKKRNIESLLQTGASKNDNMQSDENNPAKKSKLQESEFISDRFKKMMAMTSKHADLLDLHDSEEKEKYFHKLEAKEKMEDKMANTHKVKCKAVKCLQCKYTSFSASELCKTERHTLKICKKFNEVGSKLLSRGFIQLEKRHATIYKRVKSALPRRESERKTHPLARHSDILQAVETRLSMLNMTYMRYIDNRLICFIPGKVLDETKSILDLIESNKTPPRTHQLLQELRDLSSMAIDHFDEHILPRCREQLEQRSGSPEKILKELEVVAGSLTPFTKFQGIMYKNFASSSKQPARILIHQQFPQALTNELFKVKKIAKNHKHHISYLTQNTQRLCLKLRKQNNKLRIQAVKLREQERKLQEQNTKIMEQDVALNDIKKHMDEWDQKYKDLTAELVRARDEILLKASSSSPVISSPLLSVATTSSPSFKSNIKPRMAHILPKNYLTLDVERKRKSSLSPEIPLKRNRSPSAPLLSSTQKNNKSIQNVSLNIPDLVNFESNESNKDSCVNFVGRIENTSLCNRNEGTSDSGAPESTTRETTAIISSFLDNLLTNPLKCGKARKRKLFEDIDLK